jgi:hypothetical protein
LSIMVSDFIEIMAFIDAKDILDNEKRVVER